MKPITTIVIRNVEEDIDSLYIQNLFEDLEIAEVSNVSIFRFNGYKETRYIDAHVNIKKWHETETAYNFIYILKYSDNETRLYHSQQDWWVVENTSKNSAYYNKQIMPTIKMALGLLGYSRSLKPNSTIIDTQEEDNEWKDIAKELANAKREQNSECYEWDDIAEALYNAKEYQNLECDLEISIFKFL